MHGESTQAKYGPKAARSIGNDADIEDWVRRVMPGLLPCRS